MRNNLLLIFVICITVGFGFGQDQIKVDPAKTNEPLTEEELKEQIRRQRIAGLQSQAELQPVELAADILFKMIDANLISEHNQKIQILESLFIRASEAKNPFKMRNYYRTVDSRSGYRSMTHELELDRLSIQLKAVEQMLKIDKNRSREMFSSIPQLKLPQLKCEDSMLPEINRFYTTLGSIISQTFDAEAKEQKQDMFFTGSYIDRIQSPLELKPAADMLVNLNVSKEYFDFLLHRYITAMGHLTADPRSLSIALRFHDLSNSIKSSLYSRSGNTPASSEELIKTYRKMLVSSLSERQCADYLFITEVKSDDPNVPPQKIVHQSVSAINDILELPITVKEIEPRDVGARSEEYEFWKRSKSSRLLLEGQKLRFGNSKTPLTPEQRLKPEWQGQLMIYRQMLADWKPEDEETAIDYFDQKNVLYMNILELTRDNETLMSEIMIEYAIFVRDSTVFKEFPAEWLKYARQFRRPMPTWSDDRKKRFYETLTSSSSEGFPLMFELQALIDEKK